MGEACEKRCDLIPDGKLYVTPLFKSLHTGLEVVVPTERRSTLEGLKKDIYTYELEEKRTEHGRED